MYLKFYSTLLILVLVVFTLIEVHSQVVYRKFIDSEVNCDEFNTQTFIKNDTVILINFISCDSNFNYTKILMYDQSGNLLDELNLPSITPNVNSASINGKDIFLAGVNSGANPDSKIVTWHGTTALGSGTISEMNLFSDSSDIYLNPIGAELLDSNKIVYGQYRTSELEKVYSFILWDSQNYLYDSLLINDTMNDWSIVCDAAIDHEDNLLFLSEVVEFIDHIDYRKRVIRKYNQDKELLYEWFSPIFTGYQGLSSFCIFPSGSIALEFVSREDNHVHSLWFIDKNGDLQWEFKLHEDDLLSLYRINDLIIADDKYVIGVGTYKNISQNIFETGYIFKIDTFGNVIWEKIFYDQYEEFETDFASKKIMHFNSVHLNMSNLIFIGGRVIHNAFTEKIQSDIILTVLDSAGCINKICPLFQDISSIEKFTEPHKLWIEGHNVSQNEALSIRYRFDTIPIDLDGKAYFRLLESDSQFSDNWVFRGEYIREENNQLFHYQPGGEQILYDFNLVQGDTFHLGVYPDVFDMIVENLDTISLMNGDLKRMWVLTPLNPFNPHTNNQVIWIEDIGNMQGFLENLKPWSDDANATTILCVYLYDNLIYDNPEVDSCWVLATSTKDVISTTIKIFPNPVTDLLYFTNSEQIQQVNIFDTLGRQLYSGKATHTYLDEYPSGLYFITIYLNNGTIFSSSFLKL